MALKVTANGAVPDVGEADVVTSSGVPTVMACVVDPKKPCVSVTLTSAIKVLFV